MEKQRPQSLLRKLFILAAVLVSLTVVLTLPVSAASVTTQPNTVIDYPGTYPGTAQASLDETSFQLSNDVLSVRWEVQGNRIAIVQFMDKAEGKNITMRQKNLFSLTLRDGTVITQDAPNMTLTAAPALTDLEGNAEAIRLAERDNGKMITATYRYETDALAFDVEWSAVLRDGNCNVQQRFIIKPIRGEFNLKQAKLIDVTLPNAVAVGQDVGKTVVSGNVFMGIENPMALTAIQGDDVSVYMEKADEIIAVGNELEYTQSIGVVPAGQLRRGFLYYLQRERVHYRRPTLHYVSWFDMVGGPEGAVDHGGQNEANTLFRIQSIGEEMTERGAQWDSFLLDDNWDDPSVKPIWNIHPTSFPNQFSNLKEEAAKYGASMGTWFSPFGGYGENNSVRVQTNPDMNPKGNYFALSDPSYNQAVRNMTFDMVENQGVSLFKIDGIGGGLYQSGPKDENRKDYEALLQLLLDLREVKPDYAVYVTVGTWSSPYWYWYADAIYRDGEDTPKTPVGNERQQIITGRDSQVYLNNVCENVLHPVAELSAGGFTFSVPNANGLSGSIDLTDEQTRKEVKDDMRWFFTSGYSLQEMPIAVPSIMKMEEQYKDFFWDNLARYSMWSRENIDLLADSHMVGNPTNGTVYGYASWSPSKAILGFRNPTGEPLTFSVNPKTIFEPASGTEQTWSFTEIDQLSSSFVASNAQPYTVTVPAFSVLVFEAQPVDVNLALNKEVTSSSVDTNNNYSNKALVDGDKYINPDGWTGGWSNNGDSKTDDVWVMVNLGELCTVRSINLLWSQAIYAPAKYEMQYSVDGKNFETLYRQDTKESGAQTHTFTPVEAQYIRLYIPQDPDASHVAVLLHELEVMGAPVDQEIEPEPLKTNLALNKPVTSSSVDTANKYSNEALVDGDKSNDPGYWTPGWSNNGDSKTNDVWVMVDLTKRCRISSVNLQWGVDIFAPAQYEMQYSLDGENFETLYRQDTKESGAQTHTFEPVDARYVRLYIPQDPNATWDAVLLHELEVMGYAYPVAEYNLTVTNGSGSGSYAQGDTVTADAAVPQGSIFAGWTAEGLTLTAEQTMSLPLCFEMPANDVTLTAKFEEEAVEVTGVVLDKQKVTLHVGDTMMLTATVKPDTAQNKTVTWSSDDPDVATVENGTVHALRAGLATITVETVDGGFTAECVVKVRDDEPVHPPKPEIPQNPDDTQPVLPFADVYKTDWYYDAVQYVYENELMNGTGLDTFSPQDNTTRGMIVTILYRQSGSPAVHSDGATWWSDARVWAMNTGISDGTNMDAPITREQLATMLYRFALLNGKDAHESGSISQFADAAQVSDWADEAMQWIVGEEILLGKPGNRIDPQGMATRCEVATMLMRFIENS